MSSADTANAPSADGTQGEQDLGPLAWVLDELSKSLNGAVKAMRRFMRGAEAARDSDLASLDAGTLRMARQQLHQASGALEMVSMEPPALVLRAMENAVQRFVQRPELCSNDAVGVIERASFALIQYLESVLSGKQISPVTLFPQYREVQALAGAERVHPADLWPVERRFRDFDLPLSTAPLPYGPEARTRLDSAVLGIVRNSDEGAENDMRSLCMGFAAAQTDRPPRVFWKICAGFFEALAHGLLKPDVYVKRVASRVLMQYVALSKGDGAIPDRLAQDVLFFCTQAGSPDAGVDVPVLRAVRQAFGLERYKPVDYETPRFGLFDPALLTQARKRIATATETWSALAGGDTHKLKPAADQFALVCESLRKLQPDSEPLAQALTRAIDATTHSGQPPSPALAMEVATSVLYLQASFQELDAARDHMAERAARLAARLDGVLAGGEPQPLEEWMEELYRRVSDHQTMGSVVGELRATLGEAEKSMDQFFRDPKDLEALKPAPGCLQQMRGVLSVLGLDQAALAVTRMRETVERLLINDVAEDERQKVFEKLGNSLGALGFLIDMLSYQRTLARKLFVYDEELGELRILMGRTRAGDSAQAAQSALQARGQAPEPQPEEVAFPDVPEHTGAASFNQQTVPASLTEMEQPAPVKDAAPAQLLPPMEPPPPSPSAAAGQDEGEDDLQDIFLEEAREVVGTGLATIETLRSEPGDLSEQTTLRRAFHTLKGSSRMVGLSDFGEAAWAMEQALNAWLAEQKPIKTPLLDLSGQALRAFGRWVDDIAAGSADHWNSQAFRVAADAMRVNGILVPLDVPGAVQPHADEPAAPQAAEAPEEPETSKESGPQPEDKPAELQPEFAVAETIPAELGPAADFVDTTINEANKSADANEPVTPAVGQIAEDIDFSVFEQALKGADEPQEPPATDSPAQPPAQDSAPLPFSAAADAAPQPVAEPASAAAPAESAPEAPAADASADDEVKVIGDLRIDIPLYNVYLNEADEWSRHLVTALNEWSLELHRPLPDTAVALAHSLAGSSATVGFTALSELARTLEHALQHAQLMPENLPKHARTFNSAAEDIRRLLHQFAAGFLKQPDEQVREQLEAILEIEVISSGMPLEQEPETLEADGDFKDTDPETTLLARMVEEPPPSHAPVAAAPAPAVPAASAHNDDIDVVDVIDPDLFPIFEEEALELLPRLSGALRQWSERPDNLNARSELLRALHTLKGSSRLAGAMRLGEMAHRMESAVQQIDTDTVTTQDIDPLLTRLDAMQASFDTLRTVGAQPLTEPVTVQPPAPAPAAPAPTPASAPAPTVTAAPAPLVSAPVLAQPAPAAQPTRPAVARPPASVPVRPSAGQLVRVRSQLLDRLVNQAGEVMIARSRLDARMTQLSSSLGDLTGNLDRLRRQLRDIEVQAESQMQSRLALSKDSASGFDPLEFDRFTRVQELTRMMAESVNDVATVQRNMQRAMEGAEDDLVAQGRQARELQRELLRTRMVEFDSISERLYAVVRLASKEAGKQVKLDISGGTIEMDRGVLERMTPAFEHLLRNCCDHGIEAPQARAAAGKAAVGTITIGLRQEGNDVSVEFRDDGAGLNMERIRAKAIERGLLAKDAPLTEAEAFRLIFMPGFSTSVKVTGLSGRGIGMDVVRTEVNALGGRIETASETGKGSSFRLVLPLTTAVTQVVMLRAGNLTFGVPASLAEIVRRTAAGQLDAAYASGRFHEGQEDLPFYWAGALLQASAQSQETAGKTHPVLVLHSAAQRIAIHVDEVLGSQEVVVKNLGPQLSRLPGLAGMSVLASGAVVLIYNPVALAMVYGEQARGAMRAATAPAAAAGAPAAPQAALPPASAGQVPLILVVDDSITVRRVTQRLLRREGYRVALANDGLQALEQLQKERPAVVLSDIEMPRMDGFDLVRNIRADAKLRDLPVIMITSRIAQKHRDHADELGVSHYLGKPYSDEELIGLVQGYTQSKESA